MGRIKSGLGGNPAAEMKILALTNLFPPHGIGGYELICYRVVRELRRRGHTIEILTSDHEVAGVASEEEPWVERSLKIHGFYGHPWRNIGRLAFLERHNNAVLKWALRRHRPDLVYVWNMGGLSKSMLFTLQQAGVPVVFYMSDHWIGRGLKADVWLQWWNRAEGNRWKKMARSGLTRLGVRGWWQRSAPTNPIHHLKFSRIYFCSRALRAQTVAEGFDVGHGAVIYCPVDTREFYGEPRGASEKPERWLYAGRLAEDKGVMTLLRALDLLKGRFEGRLSLYGRGDEDYVRRLQEFVRTHSLPVNFCSAAPERMPGVFRVHDVLVFPSEWEEPFALTPLEAMASGLPVIATTTGGSAELFRDGENALTYPAGQAEALAAKMETLAQEDELRERIARAGWCEARQNYDEARIVDQIEAYLEETPRHWEPPGLPRYDS